MSIKRKLATQTSSVVSGCVVSINDAGEVVEEDGEEVDEEEEEVEEMDEVEVVILLGVVLLDRVEVLDGDGESEELDTLGRLGDR